MKSVEKEYYSNGKIKLKTYYINDGLYKKIFYYENGNIKCEEYYKKDKLHRKDKPTIIKYNNGNIHSKIYYNYGKQHRENGPAIIQYDKNKNITTEMYCINGNFHNTQGPAKIDYIYRDNNVLLKKEYYINGNIINLNKYKGIDIENIYTLIKICKRINELLELKLIVNIKYNKNKELLDLIDSKLIMLKLA